MKIVIDANVYASALMKPEGTPGKMLDYIIDSEFAIVVSLEIIDEIEKILNYPKIRQRILLSDNQLQDWLDGLKLISESVNIKSLEYLCPVVLEDPDDDKYILATIASGSKYLITGDQHLLKLHPYGSVRIVKPADFLNLINEIQNV